MKLKHLKKRKKTASEVIESLKKEVKNFLCARKVSFPFTLFAVKISRNDECEKIEINAWKTYYETLSEIFKWFEKEFKPRGLL